MVVYDVENWLKTEIHMLFTSRFMFEEQENCLVTSFHVLSGTHHETPQITVLLNLIKISPNMMFYNRIKTVK